MSSVAGCGDIDRGQSLQDGLRPATSSLSSSSNNGASREGDRIGKDGNVCKNEDNDTMNVRRREDQHYQAAVENTTRAMKESSIAEVFPQHLPGRQQQQDYSSSYPTPSLVGTPDILPSDRLPQHVVSDATSTAAAAASVAVVVAPLVPKRIETQERENFLFFIKILFKILDDAHQPLTKQRAKRIVLECRRKNQLGDPLFHPLMEAVESRLRRFVGEPTWRRAHLFLHHYITTKRQAMVEDVSSSYNLTRISITAAPDAPPE
jgi:hypothetical protein